MKISKLKGLPEKLYRIYDLDFEEYWSNDHGNSVWTNPGHAKNSWNSCNGRHSCKFSEQEQFAIHIFEPATGWKLVKVTN